MKSLLLHLLVFMIPLSVTAQKTPDTIKVKEPFTHESPGYNPRKSNLNTDFEDQPVSTNEQSSNYNQITIKLISELMIKNKPVQVPIKNGTVFSKPAAEKINTDLTDQEGIGILELIPGKYRIYGQAKGYQARYKDIGHRDRTIVIKLVLLDDLKARLERLIELIKANQFEKAKKYLEEIELLYPDNPDLNFIGRENSLK